MIRKIIIDPKMFIFPPYWNCPKCNAQKSFGVLTINGTSYTRECKECGYNEEFPLPTLNKKVIYLDQFAISNMAKAIIPSLKAHKNIPIFWKKLFEKLRRLVRLQLLICPFSSFHVDESLLSPHYEEFRGIYNLLSGGISFIAPRSIKIIQVYEYAKKWASGMPAKEIKLEVESIVNGKINYWTNNLSVQIEPEYDKEWKEYLHSAKKKLHKKLIFLFKKWQKEKGKNFKNKFEEEISNFAQLLFKAIRSPNKSPKILSLFSLSEAISRAFVESGIQNHEFERKVSEFLFSPYFKEVPFIKIATMLFVALGRKAAAGQKKFPSEGMVTDIHFISLLLPYCDAMFVDRECHSLLREMPLRKELDYGTQLFSMSNKEKFLEYLDQIEKGAPKEILDKVREVYGDK